MDTPPTLGPLERLRRFVKDFGWRIALLHLLYKYVPLPGGRIRLKTEHAQFPLWARLGSSDILLFRQIFFVREFACIDNLRDLRLILDCGANVGYTASYFLSRYPDAFVVAVEPDDGNFAMLQKNLAPYEGRFKLIKSAIWSKNTGLRISELPFRDQREWSISVRQTKPNEPAQMNALTINELFAESKFDRISLLKIDIEGAEQEVFSAGELEPWLSKTDCLTIELHSDECVRAFVNAIASQNFTMQHAGDLTVCTRA